jgi:hypothetical protein
MNLNWSEGYITQILTRLSGIGHRVKDRKLYQLSRSAS